MRIRIVTGIALASLSLLVVGTSLAGEARPLEQGVLIDAPPQAALFHPDNPASLAVLDNMRDAGNHDVLGVCVGVGCSAAGVGALASERGWPFTMAYDVSGDQATRLLGSAKVPDVVRITAPAVSVPVPARSSAAAQSSAPSGLVAGLSGIGGGGTGQGRGRLAGALTTKGDGPSLLQMLLLSIPVGLLGLGVGVLYLGTRRKDRNGAEERDESALLAQHIHERHGRKSARGPSTA
jgi:hypothetical protein